MKKTKAFIITLAALLALSSALCAWAQIPENNTYEVKQIVAQAQKDHPKMWMELSRRIFFYHSVSDRITLFMDSFCTNLLGFMLMDPPLSDVGVTTLLNYFITMMQPLYGITILATGIYLIFVSGSPSGRVKAKFTIVTLVIGMGLITLTLPLMQLILQVPHALSSLLLSRFSYIDTSIYKLPMDYFAGYFFTMTFFESTLGSPFLLIPLLLPAGVLMVFSARYLMIILLTVFFPFTVLFYSFPPLRPAGSALLKQTLLWAIVPVIETVLVIMTWIGYLTLVDLSLERMQVFIVFAGLMLMAFAPIITLFVVSWVYSSGLMAYAVAVYSSTVSSYFTSRTAPEGEEEYSKEKEEN
jgi:hypothetical protein